MMPSSLYQKDQQVDHHDDAASASSGSQSQDDHFDSHSESGLVGSGVGIEVPGEHG